MIKLTNIKTEVVKGHSVAVMESLCQWLVLVLSESQWGHTVVVLGRIMSIENIQNASVRDDTRLLARPGKEVMIHI